MFRIQFLYYVILYNFNILLHPSDRKIRKKCAFSKFKIKEIAIIPFFIQVFLFLSSGIHGEIFKILGRVYNTAALISIYKICLAIIKPPYSV